MKTGFSAISIPSFPVEAIKSLKCTYIVRENERETSLCYYQGGLNRPILLWSHGHHQSETDVFLCEKL